MRVSDAEVRQLIFECVKSFYSSVAPKQMLDGTDGTTRKPRTFPSNNRFSRLSLSEALSWRLWWHACAFLCPLCFFSSLFFSFVFFMFSLLELVRFHIDMYMSLQPYPVSYEAVQD